MYDFNELLKEKKEVTLKLTPTEIGSVYGLLYNEVEAFEWTPPEMLDEQDKAYLSSVETARKQMERYIEDLT